MDGINASRQLLPCQPHSQAHEVMLLSTPWTLQRGPVEGSGVGSSGTSSEAAVCSMRPPSELVNCLATWVGVPNCVMAAARVAEGLKEWLEFPPITAAG